MSYVDFLASKAPRAQATGMEPFPMPAHLFDYQAACVEFALRQGRSGLFLDTGLGKTRCELEFALQAADATNGRALILTPLAVARQIEREAEACRYNARVVRDQSEVRAGISICNYDRLDKLDLAGFGAVVLDESSILKSFGGRTSRALIEAFSRTRFRLAATATPAPNDHMELGQHAEFLSIMSGVEMLSRFFINDTSTASQQWRLKRHAEAQFWDWMASWSRMAATPADLGFDGSRHVLPALHTHRHQTYGDVRPAAGSLFAFDTSATGVHDVKRQTTEARADAVAAIVHAEPGEAWVVWCDTDYEADALAARIPDAVEVRGSQSTDQKEEALAAFADGQARVIITKPSICGYGLNWQHAARMAFVGRSFSYESWYQAIRRSWRFGQKRDVHVHLVVAEGEDQIGRVIERKAADHQSMKAAMATAMRRAMGRTHATRVAYQPTHSGRMPAWLS
ncbi:MAG: helicase [Betaproteobacteria bacterium]|nr:helicase [Betaproteobacteria bacterium]